MSNTNLTINNKIINQLSYKTFNSMAKTAINISLSWEKLRKKNSKRYYITLNELDCMFLATGKATLYQLINNQLEIPDFNKIIISKNLLKQDIRNTKPGRYAIWIEIENETKNNFSIIK